MLSHFAVAYTAIEEQRRALAAAALVGDGHDRIMRRGSDEAFACRDMLEPAARQRSRIAQMLAHLTRIIRSLAAHKLTIGHRTAHSEPTSRNADVTRRPAG
jgi:hypothetical protein